MNAILQNILYMVLGAGLIFMVAVMFWHGKKKRSEAYSTGAVTLFIFAVAVIGAGGMWGLAQIPIRDAGITTGVTIPESGNAP